MIYQNCSMLCCVRQLCTDECWFRFTFSFCALVYIGLAVCVFFWFSLDYFVLVLFAFIMLGLVSSVIRQEIGWE